MYKVFYNELENFDNFCESYFEYKIYASPKKM